MAKHKQRRLDYLCTTQGISYSDKDFSIRKHLDTLLSIQDLSNKSNNKVYTHDKRLKDRIELLNLFIELGYSDEDAYSHWVSSNWEQRRRSGEYSRKPIPIRKDNPNTYGEKFSGAGTRRQPRKCRKTAWKRFKKLFPEHKII
jgi:hypothetical protein